MSNVTTVLFYFTVSCIGLYLLCIYNIIYIYIYMYTYIYIYFNNLSSIYIYIIYI